MAPVDSSDTKRIDIDNLDELARILSDATHRCTSQEILTDIRISVAETNRDIISLSASFQELNASFQQYMEGQNNEMQEQKEIIRTHTADLADVKHNCREPQNWNQVWKRLDVLERDYERRNGSGKWEDRIYNGIQAIVVALVVIVVAYIMAGGTITR